MHVDLHYMQVNVHIMGGFHICCEIVKEKPRFYISGLERPFGPEKKTVLRIFNMSKTTGSARSEEAGNVF